MDWTSSASGSPRRKIPGRTSGHQLSEQTTGSSPLDPASSNVNATSASDASANDRKRQIIMSRKPKLVRRDLRTTQSSGALDVKHRQDFIANKTNEQLHNDQHDRFRKEQQTEQQSQVDLVKDWDWKLDTSKSTGSADNRAERNSEHDALRAGQESVHQEDYEPKPFLINYSEIEIGKVLGRGACATVYEGKWLHIPVAVKIFNDINGQHAGIERLASSDENDRKAKVGDYEKEFWLLLQIRHPNCLLYMGICFEPVVCIVTELFSGGSIANYLHGPKAQKFSPSKGLEMISGVARGMYYLHASTPPILHRDLKASNILINSMITHCVICDFGLSDQFFRDVSGKNSTDPGGGHGQGEMIGTVYTMAPEVMEGKEYTPASDVYSFGVLMYEIYTGRTPFPNLKPIQIMFQVCDGNRPKFFESDKVPPLLRDLIMRCWAHDPEDRPSFKAVVEALTDENLKSEVTIAQAAENELKKPDVGELSKRLLDVAFMGNDDELLKLINAGADINYSDYDKRTALHVGELPRTYDASHPPHIRPQLFMHDLTFCLFVRFIIVYLSCC